jgi:uncharacterized lipoprotein YajG
MKTILVFPVIALLALAGCDRAPETTSVQNDADRIADALEQKADNLTAMADATTNADTAALLEGVVDNLEDRADNVRDAAEDNGARP